MNRRKIIVYEGQNEGKVGLCFFLNIYENLQGFWCSGCNIGIINLISISEIWVEDISEENFSLRLHAYKTVFISYVISATLRLLHCLCFLFKHLEIAEHNFQYFRDVQKKKDL